MGRLLLLAAVGATAAVVVVNLPDIKRYFKIRSLQGQRHMCLGIPGRVVEVLDGGEVALVDVAGVVREINLGLLDGPFHPDDYILIHSGFALERMTADEARDALAVFADGDVTGRSWDVGELAL